MSDFMHPAHFLSRASPPSPAILGLLSWPTLQGQAKTRESPRGRKKKKIAHATFYSGECLLSSQGRRGLQGKEGQVQEAPVGLNSTGKVGVQDWRPEGSGPRSHWPVPAWPRTQHSSRVGGRGRVQGSLSPTTKQRETEGV